MSPSLYIDDFNFTEKKCTNEIIRGVLTSELFPFPSKRKNLLKEDPNESMKRIRTRDLTLPISPRATETHFREMNIYPWNDFLTRRFNIDKNNCIFCNSDTDTG